MRYRVEGLIGEFLRRAEHAISLVVADYVYAE